MTSVLTQNIAHLITTGQVFSSRQWFLGTSGNMSILESSSPLQFAITGSGLDKGALVEDSFVLVDRICNPCGATPRGVSPSGESFVHSSIYQSCHAASIIHVHVTSALHMADLFRDAGEVVITGLEILKGFGRSSFKSQMRVPIISNRESMSDLADDVAALLNKMEDDMAPAVIIDGHGIFVWGDSVFAARRHVELLVHAFEYIITRNLLRGGGRA